MKELTSIQVNISGTDYNVKTDDVSPETTLNTYLREKLYLTGTKKMCMEGGCGSCIVAVEEIKPNGDKQIFAVNSCLVSILSCHGWKIHSIEGLGNRLKGFHPIQQLLADNNGTQCGFCSPGMVMNMFALHESGPKTKSDIENSFGGNICRCTGYRPIMTAFFNLATNKDATPDIEDLDAIYTKYPQNKQSFRLKLAKSNWVKVYYLKDLLELFRTSGETTYILIAGNTAQGVVWRNSSPEMFIDVASVDQLISHSISDDQISLGGNVTLTKTMEIFRDASGRFQGFGYLAKAADHIDLVANVPVRNIGTLAGNLMLKYYNQRFQSDIFLLLETIKATLIIVDQQDNEMRLSPSEFLSSDMKKKVIREIVLRPFDNQKYHFNSYKVMNRAQNTHAIVNAGFLFELSSDGLVMSANMVYGGITKDFVHASTTENLLTGLNLFDNDTLQKAFRSLDREIVPDQDPPDPEPQCRKQLAINLFYKFILSIAPSNKVSPRNQTGGTPLYRPISTGVQEYGTNEADYPVSQPTIKLEALAQTSGQAQYIIDKPDLPNQLHACLVLAEAAPGSVIKTIDPSEALATEGVVAFYKASDIPGMNSVILTSFMLPAEELFCSETVEYFSQPIGTVVATSHEIAYKACKLVKISYQRAGTRPLLTPKELLKANRTDRIEHNSSVVPKKTGKATRTVKGEFYIGGQYHFHMETHAAFVVPNDDGGLEVWASTQWVAFTQFVISQVLSIDAQKIDVTVKRLGGGFGAKINRANYVALAAALAAYKLQRPVRMWMPFHTNMSAIGKRHPLYTRYEVGVDDNGTIQNMSSELYSDLGAGHGTENVHLWIMDGFENGYKFSKWTYDTFAARTDTHPNTWTRGPGTVEGVACIESIMDHIGHELQLDPLQVRLANLDQKSFPKIGQFVEEMKTRDNLDKRIAYVNAFNKDNRWKKKGLAVSVMKWTMVPAGNYTTLVTIYFQNGGVAITHGGVEIGQGINTKAAQTCAYKLGIPIEMISVKPTTNVTSPNCYTTGASWTSEAICQSVIVACDKLLKRIEPVRKANPNVPWDVLIKLCHLAHVNLSANAYVYNDQKVIQDYPIFGVCAAEVELDILTGQKVVSRVDIIEDVGESISPLVDIGQIEGAFVMGLGYHLTEELVFSADGELLNNRTWNYTPPGVKDIPADFRVRFPANNPNPLGVLKSKATAEPPICLSVAVPLAVRKALASARADADATQSRWVPFDGPTTVEFTMINSLNDFRQYTL